MSDSEPAINAFAETARTVVLDAAAVPDPLERYRLLTSLAELVADFTSSIAAHRSRSVRDLRDRGALTWDQVGDELGLSGERARQLATERTVASA